MKRAFTLSIITVFALAILALFSNIFSDGATVKSAPPGYIRVEVTRDTWVSSYPGETEGGNGGANRLKVKGHQEMTLLDIDPSPIVGRVIERAMLHVRNANPEIPLKRIGISTINAEWTEGNGRRYAKVRGASTFRWRAYPDVPWVENRVGESGYSDLTQVMFGEGGTFWSHADATPTDSDGWQSVEVDPKILAARAAGLSGGFVVFDDTGTELIRSGENGENVRIDTFPNRFFYSRERNASSAPYFTVRLAEEVAAPAAPSAPMNLRAETAGLPAGEAIVLWEIPAFNEENIIGFNVKLNGGDAPRALIPAPSFADNSASQTIAMRLRDPGLRPGQTLQMEVAAVNEAGRTGNAAALSFSVSGEKFSIPAEFFRSDDPPENAAAAKGYALRLSGYETAALAILDELDKVSANGELIPKRPASYFAANHIWNASQNRINLAAARNEFTGFQIYLSGDIPMLSPRFKWEGPSAAAEITPPVNFSRFGYVASPIGNVPDPVIPFASDARLDVKGNISIFCEVFVPKSIEPGIHYGTLSLLSGGALVYSADVELTVWNFALPDTLSFLPEMNCYGLPENERDYYRLANLHRTYINRVPYSHRGTVNSGCAPEWDRKSRTFDWSAWDKRYGAYLDGSAFADLPRGKTPIEAFYLPVFENFPADIFTQYNGSQWADEAFTDEYRETFQAAAREFAKHFAERNWNQTCFEFFLNNKMDYKKNGWSRASSPWLLDEPSSFQDFAALKFFGELFMKGVNSLSLPADFQAKSPIRFRADISRPQWQRDSLDSSLGVNVVGGGEFHRYNRMILDRKERFDQILYTYGTTCAPEEGAYQPVLWSLDAWSLGADGIIPWQTIGTADSWKSSDALALFYPKPQGAGEDFPGVLPSLRLKGYRRGQQDIEYLVLLQKKLNRPRRDIEGLVREKLNLASKNRVNSAEDAGTLSFDAISAKDLWQFRMNVARALQAK